MPALLAVALAGALGAPARYVVDGFVQGRLAGSLPGGNLPIGTLLVNLSGSLLLGLVTGFGLYHGLHGVPKLAAGTGFCGAYTTYSTFSYETLHLAEGGERRAALGYAVISIAGCLAAAALGIALAAA